MIDVDDERPRWHAAAACRGTDPDLFFTTDTRDKPSTTEAARAVCAECPVRRACLEYALTKPEPMGVWGGLSEGQRRRERRRRDRAALADAAFAQLRESVAS